MGTPRSGHPPAQSHPSLRLGDLRKRRGRSCPSLFEDQELRLYLKGRGATYQALLSLRDGSGEEILVPAFHCCSMVEPVLRAGYRPRFYTVNRDLSVNVPDLLAQITKKTAAIIIVNYFGFDTGVSALLPIRSATTCAVIEDCAHSFLRANPVRLAGSFGDFVVYSFSKLVPSYAGGGLAVRNQSIRGASAQAKPLALRVGLVALKHLAEEIVENAPPTRIRSLLLSIEKGRVAIRKWWSGVSRDEAVSAAVLESPEYLFYTNMPWFVKYIVGATDLESVVQSRRHNYMLLDEKLIEHDYFKKVFPSLPSDTCPWAYPVLVEDRSRYDQLLRSRGVPVYTFGETLHPLLHGTDSRGREEAHYLAERLLLIPIHQNLNVETITMFTDKVNDILSRRGGKRRAADHVA
jgi:perosamine synthetase